MQRAGRHRLLRALALAACCVAAKATAAEGSPARIESARAMLRSTRIDPGNPRPLPEEETARLRALAGSLPVRWDWRDHAGVTPVKDQGTCGSCWAFATAAVLESSARIATGRSLDLSEQQVLDCSEGATGCGGGSFGGAYGVYRSHGAAGESCLPYTGNVAPSCDAGSCPVAVQAGDAYEIPEELELLKAAILTYGPLYSVMSAPDEFLVHRGGCFEKPGQTEPWNHAVAIVGWDDTECGGSGAWTCKNIWGTSWGEEGYFRIRYGQCAVGKGARAVRAEPGAVLLVVTEPPASTTPTGLPIPIDAVVLRPGGMPAAITAARLRLFVDGRLVGTSDLVVDPSGGGRVHGAIDAGPGPCTIEYSIEAHDADGAAGAAPPDAPDVLYRFDVAPIVETFEGDGDAGWTVGDVTDRASAGVWVRGVPVGSQAQPSSDCSGGGGTRCWMTGLHVDGAAADADDVDSGATTLSSPAYDLRGAVGARVTYQRWFTTDAGWAGGADRWTVEVRNDDGPWTVVEDRRVARRAWVRVERNLAEVLGEAPRLVRFRFRAEDQGEPSVVEAAIDDFVIRTGEGGEVPAGKGIAIGVVRPNPAREWTIVPVRLDAAGTVELSLVSVDGRVHKREALPRIDRGTQGIFVRCTDAHGRRLPSGAYYVVARAGQESAARGLVIVR